MESLNIGPSPIYDTKEFAIHTDGDIEFARQCHPSFFDWRRVEGISGTLVKGEEGNFSLVKLKSGDVIVVMEDSKHLARVWKDFILNYKP